MADPDFDPFADEAQTTPAGSTPAVKECGHRGDCDCPPEGKREEKNEVTEENWVSVTFPAHGGYDAPKVTVHGSADYLAGLLGVKDYDGRLSTVMKQVVKVDEFFKKQVGGSSGKG